MNKVLIIAPLSIAIGTKYKQERVNWLKQATLEAVFTLPSSLFAETGTSVDTCLMLWNNENSHSKKTYLANWKDDGYVILKGKRFDKDEHWPMIKKNWLQMYQQKDISQPTLAVLQPLTANDCWLADAWVETDYSQLTEKHFEKTIRDYLAFRISVLEEE